MDSITIVGVLGAGIILVAFILNQFGKLSTESCVYDSLNFAGSLLLIVYAVVLESYPFVVLNAVWMLVSLRDVLKK